VKGASKGEGLGNQFLGNIREVDAIVHVLRCFEDDDIQHVANRSIRSRDAEVVETELMLADLESLEKRVPAGSKKAPAATRKPRRMASVLGQALELLREGKPARLTEPKDDEEARLFARRSCSPPSRCSTSATSPRKTRPRATPSPRCSRRPRPRAPRRWSSRPRSRPSWWRWTPERAEFLEELGLTESGLARVIRAGYKLLGLKTFFTVGPKEARAWTVPRRRQGAAGGGRDPHRLRARLHPRRDHRLRRLRRAGRRSRRAEAGKLRQEGKEYVVQDGDVMLFKFNVWLAAPLLSA
jgi:ribosome-binding ATPase